MTISPVIEARRLILPSIFGALRPFMPFSRMKPRMLSWPPTLPSASSSLAQTTNTSAIGLLVIHILAPFMMKPPSTGLARVSMLAGSEPWLGSVRPKQPTHSPVASLGKKRWRCSSLPYSLMGCMTSELCTLMALR